MINIIENLLNAHRKIKQIILITFDLSIIILSIFISFIIRTSEIYIPNYDQLIIFINAVLFALPTFFIFGLYNEIIRYNGNYSFFQIIKANVTYAIIFIVSILIIKVQFSISSSPINGIPSSVIIVQPVILAVFMLFSRFFIREMIRYRNSKKRKTNIKNTLIYGTDNEAAEFAKSLQSNNEFEIIGFVTENIKLAKKKINSLYIFHLSDIKSLQIKYNIDQIIIAENISNQKERNNLIEELKKFKIKIKSIPRSISVDVSKPNNTNNFDLDINDLLGREPIKRNLIDNNNFFSNKIAIITGGGGSIGYEICSQLLSLSLKTIIVVDMSEYSLYIAERNLSEIKKKISSKTEIKVRLLDIKSNIMLDRLFNDEKPHIVFHAAAYKHVPIVEENLFEGIRNNVFGTLNVCLLSKNHSIENFVLVSTDKAVRPTNVMGATKRISELIVQSYADKFKKDNKTIFSIVRFGNVLESNGSVIPLFKSQIERNGPVTLTHNKVNRFFMTIEEAAQLVIESTTIARSGEIYLLHMGKPIKILDLATKMIEAYGLTVKNKNNPNGEIEIQEVGLRIGEKIYEELLINNSSSQTVHPKIFVANEDFIKLDILENKLAELKNSLNSIHKNDKLKKILQTIVQEYAPQMQN